MHAGKHPVAAERWDGSLHAALASPFASLETLDKALRLSELQLPGPSPARGSPPFQF